MPDYPVYGMRFGAGKDLVSVEPILTPEPGIRIFPNPASHQLQIDPAGEEITHIYLYDPQGKMIGDFSSHTGHTLDMSATERGFYILKLVHASGNLSLFTLLLQ